MPSLNLQPKILNSQLPLEAQITISTVADLVERDALTVESGDKAIVTSENKCYVYDGTSWVELPGTSSIAELTDVDLTGITNDQVLKWSSE